VGAAVAEIFAREGEPGFRAREAAALRRALDGERVVIAAGAGALVDGALRREVLGRARVVTLSAPVGVLRGRLGEGAGRPLLRGAPGALEALLEARRGVYAEAHAEVDASGPVEAVAAAVAAWVASSLRP
jgi:shikimate kinase